MRTQVRITTLTPSYKDSDGHYAHTIAIDGEDDFALGEKLPTTTDGDSAHVARDDEYLHVFAMAVFDAEPGAETTYAGVPYTSFLDGCDPIFAMFYRFEIGGSIAPFYYTPVQGT